MIEDLYEDLYVWIGKEVRTGQYGIVSILLYPGSPPLPAVFATEALAKRILPVLDVAFGHTDIQLVHFAKASVIMKLP